MTLLHLSKNPREEAAGWNFPLGIPGFRFADLNRVRRIAELDGVFRQELKAADPDLSAVYEEYRLVAGQGYEAIAASDILIRVAPHLGRFVARIFQIEAEHHALQQRVLARRTDFRVEEEVSGQASVEAAALAGRNASVGSFGVGI